MEYTFAMIKPGGIKRGLIGEIISRFEKKGLTVVSMKIINVTKEQAQLHYAEHQGKDFYHHLISYITSGPVVVLMLKGKDAVSIVHMMAGDKNPLLAKMGTIRGDYSIDATGNIIHTSDSITSAKREISIYFKRDEVVCYNLDIDFWL